MRSLLVGSSTVLVKAASRDSAERTPRPSLLLASAALLLSVDVDDLVETRRCPECRSTEHGRPYVEFATDGATGCSVSFARSAGLEVAAARVGGPVGIDIESTRAVAAHGVASTLLHPLEATGHAQLSRTEEDARLARLWVAKEALLKATGHGLRVDLRAIQLGVADEVVTVLRWPAELTLAQQPRITLFRVDDDTVGAVAEL